MVFCKKTHDRLRNRQDTLYSFERSKMENVQLFQYSRHYLSLQITTLPSLQPVIPWSDIIFRSRRKMERTSSHIQVFLLIQRFLWWLVFYKALESLPPREQTLPTLQDFEPTPLQSGNSAF